MESQIRNQGIKLSLRFLHCFCLSVTKCYQEWKLSKNGSNGFQGKSFEKLIFVNVRFYETLQILIFAYARVLSVFLVNRFLKNHDFRENF